MKVGWKRETKNRLEENTFVLASSNPETEQKLSYREKNQRYKIFNRRMLQHNPIPASVLYLTILYAFNINGKNSTQIS